MKEYADCLGLFMDKMEIAQSVICGHSMGGQIAMSFNLLHSERVDKLILLAPAGLEVFDEANKKWFDSYVTKAFYLSQTDDQIRRNFNINFYGNEVPESAEFMYADRINLKNDSIKYERYIDYILACIDSMLEAEVYNDLLNISSPTLVVFGKNDLLIPNRFLHPTLNVEDVLNEAKRIPKVETLLIDQAGHFVQWDQAEILSEKILKFIQEN
jgi:pimeloyl-ACP methyl ester carboxylesterase